jgi:putative peptidoglycan lipid II flippase
MGLGTAISRVCGLAREQAFAYFFGAGLANDAFQVAFRIPNLLRDLFAEGAMSSTLVPVFVQVRAQEGDRRAWRLAKLAFLWVFVITTAFSVLGYFFADPLVALYAGAFKEVPGKFDLTVHLTRVLFVFFPWVALAAAFMGILNACGVFFIPAFASAVFNIVSLSLGLFVAFGPHLWRGELWFTHPIEGMAWGVVLGGVAQALVQWPSLTRSGFKNVKREPSDPSAFREPALRQMLWMMIPGTVGLAATQVGFLVNTILATNSGPGAVSWLGYAFRLMQFPIGVFGVSLAAAALPEVSRAWVDRDSPRFRLALETSIRQTLAINVPAAMGLAVLSVPILALLFEYGRFQEGDTLNTAKALAAYSVGLPFYSLVKVLVRVSYALKSPKMALRASVVSVAATVLLGYIFVNTLGFWGLALSTSLAAVINCAWIWAEIKRALKRHSDQVFEFHPFENGFLWKLSTATGGMGVFLLFGAYGYQNWLKNTLELASGLEKVMFRGIFVSVFIALGVLILIRLGKILSIPEVTEATAAITSKVGRRLRR